MNFEGLPRYELLEGAPGLLVGLELRRLFRSFVAAISMSLVLLESKVPVNMFIGVKSSAICYGELRSLINFFGLLELGLNDVKALTP